MRNQIGAFGQVRATITPVQARHAAFCDPSGWTKSIVGRVDQRADAHGAAKEVRDDQPADQSRAFDHGRTEPFPLNRSPRDRTSSPRLRAYFPFRRRTAHAIAVDHHAVRCCAVATIQRAALLTDRQHRFLAMAMREASWELLATDRITNVERTTPCDFVTALAHALVDGSPISSTWCLPLSQRRLG